MARDRNDRTGRDDSDVEGHSIQRKPERSAVQRKPERSAVQRIGEDDVEGHSIQRKPERTAVQRKPERSAVQRLDDDVEGHSDPAQAGARAPSSASPSAAPFSGSTTTMSRATP